MKDRKDFAQVRLTEAGRHFAGEGETVRVCAGHMHYLFTGSTPQEVLRAREWPLLRAEHDAAGNALFEEIEVANG